MGQIDCLNKKLNLSKTIAQIDESTPDDNRIEEGGFGKGEVGLNLCKIP
jgi:hypothetical protein